MVKRTKNYCIWPLQLSKINRPGIKLSMLKCWTVSAGGAIQVLKERQKTESHYDVVTIFCSKFKHGRGYFRVFRRDSVGYWSINTYAKKRQGKQKKSPDHLRPKMWNDAFANFSSNGNVNNFFGIRVPVAHPTNARNRWQHLSSDVGSIQLSRGLSNLRASVGWKLGTKSDIQRNGGVFCFRDLIWEKKTTVKYCNQLSKKQCLMFLSLKQFLVLSYKALHIGLYEAQTCT